MLAMLNNVSYYRNSVNSWKTLNALMKTLNPSYTMKRKFGYYSTHGVCLPTLFPDREQDTAWMYSLLIIFVNLVAFSFIVIAYIFIYRKAMKQGKTATNTDTQKERGKKMRRKITRIIVTDFLSWMSICFMAFMQVAGVDIPNDTYVVVGLILIPINSALNPLLFSEAPEYIWQRVKPFFAGIMKQKTRLGRME
ncbi:relaxin receptor 1-like [Styela clava]